MIDYYSQITHHQPPYTPLHKHKTLPFISKHKSRRNKRVRKVLCFCSYIFSVLFLYIITLKHLYVFYYMEEKIRGKKNNSLYCKLSKHKKKNYFFKLLILLSCLYCCVSKQLGILLLPSIEIF